MRLTTCAVAACFFLSLQVSSLRPDELRALGGKTFTGKLAAISTLEITFNTDDGPVATPLAQVLALELRAARGLTPDVKYTEVHLLDDAILYCRTVELKADVVALTLTTGVQLRVPVNFLTWMLRDAENASLRKKFDDILSQKSKRDRIVILREKDLSPLEGTLGDIDAQGVTIQFRREGADPIGVRLDRLHGLIYYRGTVPTDSPLCRVHDTDGNMLIASKLALIGEESLAITTAFGTTISLKRDEVARLDFNLGKLTYLSDLDPVKIVQRSGIGLVTQYRKDTNLDGESIILDKQYAKGLSLHAHTELTYNLAGKYKEFKAHLGVDARTGEASQALITIFCDGEKRLAETVSLKTQKDIALNVKDVGMLRIVVSGRNFLDLHDHVTLADARVSQ